MQDERDLYRVQWPALRRHLHHLCLGRYGSVLLDAFCAGGTPACDLQTAINPWRQGILDELAQRARPVEAWPGWAALMPLYGGAVAGTGLTPVTIGKLEPGWLAPEIMAPLVRTTARQQISVGIAVDLWDTACGVHHLLFGLAPFFFMAQQAQVPNYLARYTWPQLHGLQGISTHNAHAFGYYERAYQQSPARRLMEFAFQRGCLNPAQRPTAYQWLQELGDGDPPPDPPLVTCPVCGEDNDLDEVYCRYCTAQLCGDRWCPHSHGKRFVMPLSLLARFGRHQTPERGRYCVVCGGTL